MNLDGFSPPGRAGGPGPDWVPRRAKLFEAGEYPDKGVTVRPDDLSRLAAAFAGPVPVLIEHAASPLELGYLTRVEAQDAELFGDLEFSPEAHALIESSGARSLSLGLSSELDAIVEVSLVQNPRIADARLFGASIPFRGELAEPDAAYWRRECERLRAARRADDAAVRVARWVEEGRLTPAQADAARVLASCAGAVEFDGASTPVARLFARVVEARPADPPSRETAPSPASPHGRHPLFLPEEEAFYRTHFPDVSLDAIADGRRASAAGGPRGGGG